MSSYFGSPLLPSLSSVVNGRLGDIPFGLLLELLRVVETDEG